MLCGHFLAPGENSIRDMNYFVVDIVYLVKHNVVRAAEGSASLLQDLTNCVNLHVDGEHRHFERK